MTATSEAPIILLMTATRKSILNEGTKEEWLNDLLDGNLGNSEKSTYELYKEKYPEYEGTEEEWLRDLLDGKLGDSTDDPVTPEKTVYELYKEKYPEYNGTEEQWLNDLLDGKLGSSDNTAYDRYKEKYPEYKGNEEQWLNDLLDGKLGKAEPSAPEKTAYDLYKEKYPEYKGNEEQWLNDLLDGKLGKVEPAKKTAHELYIEKYPNYKGTEEEWLKELLNGDLGRKKTFTVTFLLEKDGKKIFTTQTVKEFGTPSLPGTPTKKGYTFIAWTYDGYEWPFTYPITQDTVLTASWEPIQYNIKYNLNGGVNSDLNPTAYTIEKGFTFTAPQKPYYDFAGWYSSADFSENSRVTSVTAGNIGNIELWAKWTPAEYSIGYIGIDGASFDGSEIPSYNYESDDFTLPAVKKAHYIFAGWTSEDITEPQLNVTVRKGTHGDLKFTANWTPVTYTVTYNLNGGVNSIENITEFTVESFSAIDSIPLFDPEKANVENVKNYTVLSASGDFNIDYTLSSFKFNGWYDVNDIAKSKRITEIKLSDGNIELVADWIETEGELLNKTAPYCRDGNDILMGSIPQSEVKEEALLAELKAYEFNISDKFSFLDRMYTPISDTVPEGWTSVNNYWYKDVIHYGKQYRGVFIVRSRDGNYSQQNSGYVPALGIVFGYGYNSEDVKIHWFNYEPIRWRVLQEENGEALLLSTTMLDIGAFGHNRWELSNVRYYLNSMGDYSGKGLYDTLFSELQKSVIKTSVVDNSAESMGLGSSEFSGQATNDKLFLLSYAESKQYNATTSPYGTDYRSATLSGRFAWTRSHCPYNNNSNSQIAIIMYNSLRNHPGEDYNNSNGSIAPAMRISLQN